MWAIVISLLGQANVAKVGATTIGASGMLMLIFTLHGDLKKTVDAQEVYMKTHVKLVLEPIYIEIKNLELNQSETKIMVRDIHNHLLNKNNP